MLTETIRTRISDSLRIPQLQTSGPSLLVKIYPISHIEHPLELSDEPLLIGRESRCSLHLSDDSVSRRHALIESGREGHLISDMGSTNGTYVNEQRVSGSQRLLTGDRVRLGNQIFKYLSADHIESHYHEIIFNLMTTDGLTSAYNKRYLLETLDREIHQAVRAQTPLCVMMLDLDKFKSINDAYGHLAGDAVLVEFARRAKSVLRSGDVFARYGGEEFAAVLARTSLEDALHAAERIRQTIAATPIRFDDVLIPATVSIGLCCHHQSPEPDSTHLIALADEQLYAAKQSGRNQVRSSEK
jgi:diguanylate cyclase (GGDEF)-like protein